MNARSKTEAKLNDALATFNATAQWDSLRLPQLRQYLAEHLAAALVPSWMNEREAKTASEEIGHVLLMVGLSPQDWLSAYRAEVLHEAADAVGARCEEHGVFGVGELLRRMADEPGEKSSRAAANATPEPTGRLAHLLAAIHTHRGKWGPKRAQQLYRALGIDEPRRATAKRDLRALHALGHLVEHDATDRHFYTVREQDGGRDA